MQTQLKAGGIVVNASGEILVVLNTLGRYTFPKGGLEADEDLIATARREITEESGLTDFTVHRKIGTLQRPGYTAAGGDKPTVTKLIHFYLCTTKQTVLRPQAPDIKSAAWVKPADLAGVLSWPEEVAFFTEHSATLAV